MRRSEERFRTIFAARVRDRPVSGVVYVEVNRPMGQHAGAGPRGDRREHISAFLPRGRRGHCGDRRRIGRRRAVAGYNSAYPCARPETLAARMGW